MMQRNWIIKLIFLTKVKLNLLLSYATERLLRDAKI